MQDAMAQVKSQLGRDAVILHTRRFRKGGIFGLFSQEMFEVMAAVEPAAPKAQAPVQTVKSQSIAEKKATQPSASLVKQLLENSEEPRLTALQLEMANMKKMLEQVVQKLPTLSKKKSPLLDRLLANDIDPMIAENILQGLDEDFAAGKDAQLIQQLLQERVQNQLQRIEGISIVQDGAKVVAFIGPTGVGKTTTIAKLAASFAIKEGRRVALITADTYRISAVEQLKTYADIMGIPIDIVYTADELKSALYRHRDKELVLIDTAGRSPKNQYQLSELQSLLACDARIETHLVLSVTTKYKDALEAVDRFSICSPQKFLFTKIDEATNIGLVLNLLYHFPIGLSYITTGQNVPDDIELANPVKLANLMLRD